MATLICLILLFLEWVPYLFTVLVLSTFIWDECDNFNHNKALLCLSRWGSFSIGFWKNGRCQMHQTEKSAWKYWSDFFLYQIQDFLCLYFEETRQLKLNDWFHFKMVFYCEPIDRSLLWESYDSQTRKFKLRVVFENKSYQWCFL